MIVIVICWFTCRPVLFFVHYVLIIPACIIQTTKKCSLDRQQNAREILLLCLNDKYISAYFVAFDKTGTLILGVDGNAFKPTSRLQLPNLLRHCMKFKVLHLHSSSLFKVRTHHRNLRYRRLHLQRKTLFKNFQVLELFQDG